MAIQGKLVPRRQHSLPLLNHTKDFPYVDYPVVSNDTVTNEPFYAEHEFTICGSGAYTLSKWNGTGWTAVANITNPDIIMGRGYYAVTTASDLYVVVTEHTNGDSSQTQ